MKRERCSVARPDLGQRISLIRLAITLMAAVSLCCQLQACTWGVFQDKRLLDTQVADKTLASEIKAALVRASLSNASAISVYCFYGNVFLVGEAGPKMQAEALEIARSYQPRSVTPHWFSKTRSERSDFMLATDLRSTLIATKGLASTRIDAEVNAGRVVLLGVVSDNAEKQLAIQAARRLKGVTSVTSYLMVPPRPASLEG